MQKNIGIIVALLLGLGLGYFFGSGVSSSNQLHTMQGVMDDMNAQLVSKTGDAFDRTFITEMIIHHEGAVGMAELALKNAQRQEIKDLAQAIISAQNKEIGQMKAWLKTWYGIEYSGTINSAEGAPRGSMHNMPVPAGVGAARKQLALTLKIEENKVVIMSAYEKDWSDSCLGLGGAAESCAAVITPGYEVTMQAKGKTYVYRTNTLGTAVREQK